MHLTRFRWLQGAWADACYPLSHRPRSSSSAPLFERSSESALRARYSLNQCRFAASIFCTPSHPYWAAYSPSPPGGNKVAKAVHLAAKLVLRRNIFPTVHAGEARALRKRGQRGERRTTRHEARCCCCGCGFAAPDCARAACESGDFSSSHRCGCCCSSFARDF